MNVLLIDDHPVVREGLIRLLQELERGVAWAEASGVDEAVRKRDAFDLILLDIHLAGIGGTSGLAMVRTSFPAATLVVVSADEDPALVRRCIELGASGFIPKSSPPAVVKLALQLVLNGGVYLPRAVLDITQRLSNAGHAGAGESAAGLSERQLQVLRMAMCGKSNKMIAKALDVSEGTVKQHLSAAFRALQVTNRTEAVYRAAELGIGLKSPAGA
ncbi:MAG: response regulator transcription factor [Usitatibacter sp.]